MRESGPCKRDEDGDEEGDVEEDDHHGDGSPGGTSALPKERGESSPLCFLLHGLPLDGRGSPSGPWPSW